MSFYLVIEILFNLCDKIMKRKHLHINNFKSKTNIKANHVMYNPNCLFNDNFNKITLYVEIIKLK